MASLSTLILYLTAIVFFFGQLFRLNLFSLSFPVIDICLMSLAFVNLFSQKSKPKNKYFLCFLVFAWFSYFINLLFFRFPFLGGFSYLVRLTSLISFLIFPLKIDQKFISFLNIILIANVIFGLIQYFLWPDFTAFSAFNWDPHLYRLVSTFFDPTFTGLIYLIFLIKTYLNQCAKPSRMNLILIILTYIALALTYSRSTYLALVVVSFFYSLKIKQFKIFYFTLILILATILILPRNPGEGTKLERTSSIKAKIENYQEGIGVFTQSPFIGHGYDNLAYVRQIKIPQSHSNAGFDSSLLTILCTTGLMGLFLFLLGLKNFYTKNNLLSQMALIAVLVHSLFANSLLYPWTLFLLVII